MPEYIKAYIVISTIGLSVFYFFRKAFEPTTLDFQTFKLWRSSFLMLISIAFFAHNFWLYMVASMFLIIYMLKKTDHRFALYLLLLVSIPPIQQRIPGLFDINTGRLLSVMILLPMFLSSKWRKDTPSFMRPLSDKLLIALIILVTYLNLRNTTAGDVLRNSLSFFLDWFLPYFIASRCIQNFKQLKVVLIAITLTFIIAGTIGAMEFATNWLLYNPLPPVLGASLEMGTLYLSRAGSVRAASSLGHPLILGVIMVIAIGLYFFVGSLIKSKAIKWGGALAIAAGLVAPLSRGPWVSAAILILILITSGPKVIRRISLTFIFILIATQVLPSFPGGQKIVNLLPFVGNEGAYNVTYREKLFEKSIIIIKRNPFFGVANARNEPEMDDMVQGEGIVDIVNTYLSVALHYGLIGLMLYVSFFILAILHLRKAIKSIKDKKSLEYKCGRGLYASMLAILVVIISVSGVGVIPTMTYILAGIIFSYVRIIRNTNKINVIEQ